MLLITDTYAKKKKIEQCLLEANNSSMAVVSCDGAIETYDSDAETYRLLRGKAAVLRRIREYCDSTDAAVALMTGDTMIDFSLVKRLCLGITRGCVAGNLPEKFTAEDLVTATQNLKPIDMTAVRQIEKSFAKHDFPKGLRATADDGNAVYTDECGNVYKKYNHSVQRFDQRAFDLETLVAITSGSYYVGRYRNLDAFVEISSSDPSKIIIKWGERSAILPASKNGRKVQSAVLGQLVFT